MNASTRTMTIEDAAAALVAAKEAERAATAERIDAEATLAAMLPTKDEGTVSQEAGGYKIAVTYGMRRTIDEAALDAVRRRLPPALFNRMFQFKPSLNVRELRYVQSNEPELFAIAAQAITSKPSKPSVKVDLVAQPAKAA